MRKSADLVLGFVLLVAAAPAIAAPLALTQLTFTNTCANGSLESGRPALGADGGIVFQSNCNLTGAAGSVTGHAEIFRISSSNSTLSQITASAGCNNGDIANGAPASSADGRYTVLVSACDLIGENPDGNFEVFSYNANSGGLTQITHSADCSSFAPAVAMDGSFAFASSCDLTGGNSDSNTEIFRYDSTTNTIRQITSSRQCTGGSNPVISADGKLLVFVSNCDLAGSNADGNQEIFALDQDNASLRQLTASTDCIGNYSPSISTDGTHIAFVSGCDLIGENIDKNAEIFGIDLRSGILTQLTNSSGCLGSFDPSLDRNGTRVAFASTCDLTGTSSASWEIFQLETTQNSLVQVTNGKDCLGSFAPAISGDGRRIAFKSYCDLSGGNADHNLEIFLAQSPARYLAFANRCRDAVGGWRRQCVETQRIARRH